MSGNNVIKLEIDYYTGPSYTYQSGSSSPVKNRITLTKDNNLTDYNNILVGFYHLSSSKTIEVWYQKGVSQIGVLKLDNNPSVFPTLPNNTWVKFIAYLDYSNKKVYFETPYFGTVVAGDFLSQSTSTNLIEDFKPSVLNFEFPTDKTTSTHQMVNKYDNIKITALKSVPPEVIALSVDEVLSQKFNLYPNPATNVVNITNNENMFVEQVAIYDVTGKQLSTQTFNKEAEIQLNVENMAIGVYLLHIKTKEGTAVKRLIKK